MNFGTKIRTALRIAVSLNTAIYAVSAAVAGLGFNKLTMLWAALTVASDFVVAAITTYYNNDYTPEAERHTDLMRLEKVKEELPEDFWEGLDEEGEGLTEEDEAAEDIDDGPNDGGDSDE